MEQWFNERTAGMVGRIIWAVLGISGGVTGGLSGICYKNGWKKLLYGLFIFALAISIVLLIIGIVALICKQPKYVWYSFFRPGFVSTIIFTILLTIIPKRFTEYELRKWRAKDL